MVENAGLSMELLDSWNLNPLEPLSKNSALNRAFRKQATSSKADFSMNYGTSGKAGQSRILHPDNGIHAV